MIVGIPKEIAPGERRVAASPETVKRMAQSGLTVLVEAGAGRESNFDDDAYRAAGAAIEASADAIFSKSDIVLKVQRPYDEAPGGGEVSRLKSGSILIAALWPMQNAAQAQAIAARNVTSFAMDLMPRITRAQSMDILSSQATVAGYRAVLIGAQHLGRMMPMLTTAAGTITAAKAFVIGAGVAGLQAIATAKRLGAVVTGFDVRPAAGEQVQSLGAKFVGIDLSKEQAEAKGGYAKEMDDAILKKEQELLGGIAKVSDMVITTALIPGKPAPKLLTADAIRSMRAGAVVVDLAAEQGGNCELTQPGRDVVVNGVTVVGRLNLPSEMPEPSSVMYARNVWTFLQVLWKKGQLAVDKNDEVVAGTLVTEGGAVVHPQVKSRLPGAGARP